MIARRTLAIAAGRTYAQLPSDLVRFAAGAPGQPARAIAAGTARAGAGRTHAEAQGHAVVHSQILESGLDEAFESCHMLRQVGLSQQRNGAHVPQRAFGKDAKSQTWSADSMSVGRQAAPGPVDNDRLRQLDVRVVRGEELGERTAQEPVERR